MRPTTLEDWIRADAEAFARFKRTRSDADRAAWLEVFKRMPPVNGF